MPASSKSTPVSFASLDSIAGQSLAYLGAVSWPLREPHLDPAGSPAQDLQSMTFEALRKRCREAKVKRVMELNTKKKLIAALQVVEANTKSNRGSNPENPLP